MTVTGYRAPGSAVLHQPLDTSHLTYRVSRTYCGVDLTDAWETDATGADYTCRGCARIHAVRLRAIQPWQEGEAQHYTATRHPGLTLFHRDEKGVCSWLLPGHAGRYFHAVTDEHPGAHAGRPVRLTTGTVHEDTIGYFTDLNTAIRFILTVHQSGWMNLLMAFISHPDWDPATGPETLLY